MVGMISNQKDSLLIIIQNIVAGLVKADGDLPTK